MISIHYRQLERLKIINQSLTKFIFSYDTLPKSYILLRQVVNLGL